MEPTDPAGDPSPPDGLPPDPEVDALAAREEALRDRIRAGAATPEELRALAEDLRAHRRQEQAVWQRTVKPTLGRAGRGSPELRRVLGLAAAGLVGVLVVVVAVAVGGWIAIALVVVALLAVAYALGRRGG